MNQALKNPNAVLLDAGVHKTDITKVTVFLADMSDFATMNKMYADYFGTHKPTRSCVAIKSLPMNASFEIEVLAYQKWRVTGGLGGKSGRSGRRSGINRAEAVARRSRRSASS